MGSLAGCPFYFRHISATSFPFRRSDCRIHCSPLALVSRMDIPHRRVDAGMAHDLLNVFWACAASRCACAERMTARAVERNMRDASLSSCGCPRRFDRGDGLTCFRILEQVAIRPGFIAEALKQWADVWMNWHEAWLAALGLRQEDFITNEIHLRDVQRQQLRAPHACMQVYFENVQQVLAPAREIRFQLLLIFYGQVLDDDVAGIGQFNALAQIRLQQTALDREREDARE